MPLTLRDYRPADAKALAELFYDSVHRSALGPYTQAQLDAWAPYPIDHVLWQRRLDLLRPLVAEQDGAPVGFMTMEPSGLIGLAFTSTEHQRQGVAQALFDALEAKARRQGIHLLTVDASKLAKPFFLKQGFKVTSENQVQRQGKVLVNWTMEKSLED
ncbi:GNAT family N-acetyltransferase [Gallaecimonas pentaromativorans]|uniref:GNAT family N-acetyltransferase n=1 Tax=Gallaecimonas pentaromativorans TaxID=584787 RepID=UPI003A93FF81